MEVGAVKQDFNNEIIHLKKSLNQAKIQIIHKLTRKAKTFTEKKAPEKLKEKLKRKAEFAIREVLLLKKIKARDIAKFSIIHQGELSSYLNKPKVDNDKACARLLLHKSLQEKYKAIRNKFLNVPIRDLFMSRQERRKLKKEFKDKEKEKRKAKLLKKKNKESEWKVEDLDVDDKAVKTNVENGSNDNSENNNDDGMNDSDDEIMNQNELDEQEGSTSDEGDQEKDDESDKSENESEIKSDDNQSDAESNGEKEKETFMLNKKKDTLHLKVITKSSAVSKIPEVDTADEDFILPPKVIIKKSEKKPKNNAKNKNFNDKINQRKFKKDEDTPNQETKIVDPFFITSSGGNYMSLAEPRQPDEFKDVHRQGNRKLRRAVMFGHNPRIKPRQEHRERNNFNDSNYRSNTRNIAGNDKEFDKHNGFQRNRPNAPNRDNWSNDRAEQSDRNGFKDNKFNKEGNFKSKVEDTKPEKLHPSWEAKKRQSGILPFQGKKIVFDES